jgi:phosphatidate cytidylyltransferase
MRVESALYLRLISALILGPLVLVLVWLGGPALAALVLAAAALMGWEWARLAGRGALGLAGCAVIATILAATTLLALGAARPAGLVALGGALASGAIAALRQAPGPPWYAAGTLWIAAGTLAFLWLATPPAGGREMAYWLLAVVWVNDSAAYAVGRALGGPKLAPRLSPNKTWSGFFGGVGAAGLAGAAAIPVSSTSPAVLVGFSLLLAVAAQLGDLAESLAKRHFGVKDASGLIPGHGGLLDRVDGLLAAALLAGLASVASGRNPLLW